MKKSMIDIAFDLLSKKKKPVSFLKLWEEVAQIEGLTQQQSEDNIAQFYTDMSIDNRFAHMGENKWDLRSRHTYSEVVIDTDALLIDESFDEDEDFSIDEADEDKEEVVEDKY